MASHDSEAAFLSVLQETQHQLRAFVAGSGIPLADVDDVAQEVYVIYYREQDRRPPAVEPLSWLRGIARHRCADYFRKRKRAERHWTEMGQVLEQESSALEGTEPVVLVALKRCVERLPERHQAMLRAYYVDDASADEIGRSLKRSPGAVRVAMLRLRDALRGCLDRKAAERLS